ncbi:hypothetical protein OAU72_00085 [Hyphomicrobiales bacterium]|nr:hypothetical protein [Hyphomicrobiales bacterium]
MPEIKHHNRSKWCDPFICFYHVFKEKIATNADIGTVNYQELERQNPVDTISVSNIPSDIANLFNASHENEYFYICKVPSFRKKSYLLFSIYWETEWEVWRRGVGNACIGASSHLEASNYLLKEYSMENSL